MASLFARYRDARSAESRDLSRQNLPASFFGTVYPGQYETPDAQLVSPSAAMRLGVVYACVRLLSETAASLPLVAYRDTTAGRVRATGRLADLLSNPAPGVTQVDLIGTLMAHLNLFGNAFIGKYRDENGVITAIGAIHPATVTVSLRAGEPIYTLTRMDGTTEHDRSDILHVKALSTDNLLGLSPVQLCRQTLSLAYNLSEHSNSFAKNAGRLGGILRIPGWRTAQPGKAEQVRADYEEKFAGAQQSGKLLLLAGEENVSYTQLALNMVDSQFIEQSQMALQDVCRIFRVAGHLVGVPTGERLTYVNAQEFGADFLRFSLAPWLARVEQAITADDDLSPSTQCCEFDVDRLLRADTATRAVWNTAALNPQTGWATRAEIRAMEGMSQEDLPNQPAPSAPDPALARYGAAAVTPVIPVAPAQVNGNGASA
jgi:HK97 family phage portal protein